ncbi:MAG: HD domain-containing protein [Actinomycetota bacterium]
MGPTPLRPPTVDEAADALAPVLPVPIAWPAVFDAPAAVERAWTDYVATLPHGEMIALRQALAFARARHGAQTRRGGTAPYWVHLVRVGMELASWRVETPVLLKAALLHDVVEDTPTTIQEVAAGFGDDVAGLVDWLTVMEPAPEGDLRRYYLRLATEAPSQARLLKIADRVDNLRSVQALVMRTGDAHRAWAGRYLDRTHWQVLPLVGEAPSAARVALVMAMADLAPLVEGGTFTQS